MKNKTQILIRKLLHVSLLIPFSLYWMLLYQGHGAEALDILILTLVAFIAYEYFRLERNLSLMFSSFIKPRERHGHVDGLNLLIAGIVVHMLFDLKIAMIAVLIGIIGDAASTLGGLYGKMKVFPDIDIKTTWEGLIGTFLVNILLSVSVLGFGPLALGMSFAGVILETSVHKLDDNLVVPIGSAFIGHVISWWLY